MDSRVVRDAAAMIAGMDPELRDGVFVFCGGGDAGLEAACAARAIATFVEPAGLSFIVPLSTAMDLGLPVDVPMRCITLRVHAALDGVGLTAAVATALAARGIACNMVAAFRHDHVFVPEARAQDAMTALRALQRDGR
jgi:hypothetical protein